jgi:hypothetical protein
VREGVSAANRTNGILLESGLKLVFIIDCCVLLAVVVILAGLMLGWF